MISRLVKWRASRKAAAQIPQCAEVPADVSLAIAGSTVIDRGDAGRIVVLVPGGGSYVYAIGAARAWLAEAFPGLNELQERRALVMIQALVAARQARPIHANHDRKAWRDWRPLRMAE